MAYRPQYTPLISSCTRATLGQQRELIKPSLSLLLLNLQGLLYSSYYYYTLLTIVQLDVLYRLLFRVIEVWFYSLEGFFYLNILYSSIAL